MQIELELDNITMIYPGVRALNNLSVTFRSGEVHAIVGKNGSGKSTIVKTISGAIIPTEGSIRINGKTLHFSSPKNSIDAGIATVYQELSLIPEMAVTENILLGRLPHRGKIRIDWKAAHTKAEEILEFLDCPIPVKTTVGDLKVWQQQVVEIAKAVSLNAGVIMFDEPTSALARHEKDTLFKIIARLKNQGVAIIYISHRLQELYEIADLVTVLRDGNKIGTERIKDAPPQAVLQMMFGGTKVWKRPADLTVGQEPALELKNFSSGKYFQNINIRLMKGEILGIAGTVGTGRTELLRAIFGADPHEKGEVLISGKQVRRPSPSAMKRAGVGLTPESRKEDGLVLGLPTRENLCMACLEGISNRGIVSKKREGDFVQKQVSRLQIKVPDITSLVSTLSGGNQQKVVIGKWLNAGSRVMLFDEPSRGIDVAAKQQIFQIIWELSRSGVSSIFVSSELEELIEVCHRILIMKNGRIECEVSADEVSVEQLYELCMEMHPICKKEEK